jgi:hypothetical protein
MIVKQCDKCRKIIGREAALSVGLNAYWHRVELCAGCAAPVLEVLKNNEIVDDNWLKKLAKLRGAV